MKPAGIDADSSAIRLLRDLPVSILLTKGSGEGEWGRDVSVEFVAVVG